MSNLMDYLFGAATFVPHGYCLSWRPDLVALHAVSDALIAVAYITIPMAVIVFLRQRKDLDVEAKKLASLFAAFIVACAITHLTALFVLWVPAYGAQGLIKAATALISVVTAIAIWPLIPKLLALPSPNQLAEVNRQLQDANKQLEVSVRERTEELKRINALFEMALNGSNITVYTQTPELEYTWVHNPRLGLSEAEVVGKRDVDIMPPEVAEQTMALKRKVLATGQPGSVYLSTETEVEGRIYVELNVHPTFNADGAMDGLLGTVVDMTEKNLFEVRLASMASQLSEANQRFETALDGSLITVFEQDADLAYIHVVNPPAGTSTDTYIGKTDYDLLSPEEQLIVVAAKKRVLDTGKEEAFEADLNSGGEARFYNIRLEPKISSAGDVTGLIGTTVDLTHKRRNEQQMRLVMRELTHRSKNLLAVIQAMARQTAARSNGKEDFVERFALRLRAIAASHDLLVSHSWYGASVRDLLKVHLAQTLEPDSDQVELEGEDIQISADAAQNLGLGFHELTTNAAKYGALSTSEGRLKVSWEVKDDLVQLTWKESGGPKVEEPKSTGFGSVLLQNSVGPSLGGDVKLEFEPSGVRCVIEFPDSCIVSF
ncbi:PAS domain-containing protein [Roseibium sp. CAU 1637]|uniref:Blue-light-activated histidine kinase n=1 Tax=Roseibium limicola TaxID=2816037 RepID=A0A939JBD6_9HYPH|nr:HWE histidine kinase domain-containing protein [Roseibium limicola]MBO0347348.1 PAS domain-containing protein [Roseibium limicola]